MAGLTHAVRFCRMVASLRMKLAIAAGLVLTCTASASAQTVAVKIVDRPDSETDYTYVVPGHFDSSSNANVNRNASGNDVNCNGCGTDSGTSTPAYQVSYRVRGATFSLLLPDGRVAIVNCESRFEERLAGPASNHRSCRAPIVDGIEAEFNGDKAKLMWPVSLDGKMIQTETYRVLGILDALQSDK